MRTLRALSLRLLGLFRARRPEDDFTAELESHVALHTDDGVRAGLSPEEARRQALIRLGGAEQTRQAHRERRTLPWLDSLLQDARYGLRTLRRSPGFTITAVLTLALGIGACTAIFSLVNAVLIRSLPYGDPDRLVYLFTPNPHLPVPPDVMSPSYADFFDVKRQSQSFADMTAFEQATYNIASHGSVENVGAARVDESFFNTLQSSPEFGRAIGADDNQPGHDKVAVISHALWQSMFAGSMDVLTRSLPLNGVSYRIVGVMQPGFEYPQSSDLPYGNIKATHIWIPLALTSKQKAEREMGNDQAIARLRPGVSISRAQSEMSTIMVPLDKLHSVAMFPGRGWGALVKSFMDYAVGQVGRLLWLLLGAVAIVLLIACGNAANLLLARASNRMRELGLRVALGASRRRIVRQLLTESMLIGVAAGVIGVGLAGIFLRFLPLLDPGNIPRLNQASLDMRVMLFTVMVSLLTSVLTGILPALAVSRVSPGVVLASASSGNVAGVHGRSQSILIVGEAALVVVLLACAGLLIRSYINVESVDTGFSSSTVTVKIALDPRYSEPQQRRAFFQNFIGKVAALPGVSAVGAVSYLPLSNSESLGTIWVDGFTNSQDQMAEGRGVTPQYFRAMSIPLLAGRYFTEGDYSKAETPMIINQRFAKQYFGDRNPIGGRVAQSDDHSQWSTIVGVVADVRHLSLEETPQPQMYSPSYDLNGAYIAVRSQLPPSIIASELRSTLKAVDPGLPFGDVQTMGDLVSVATARRRFQTSLLTVFAGIALFLALVGLYGLMAYSVSRRTRELGIRMALGAQRTDVMLLVLKRAALLLGLGLVSGLACSWIATRAIKAFLFGVSEHDPATILFVCLLLAVCGLIAALVPARRAASIDPMQALRTE
jgi:predicted permease